MKIKIMTILLLAVATVLTGVSCRKDSAAIKIGISIPSADHGWTGGVVYWAEQAKKDIQANNPDVEVILASAKDSAEQVDQIERMLVQGIKNLVVLPNEPAPLLNVCKKAKEQGIGLVVVDRGLPEPVADITVVGNNTAFGEAAAKSMGTLLNGKGKVVIMEGIPCQVNTDRVEAFRKTIAAYPGIEIIATGVSNWSTEKGLSLMENFLQKFPQIDAVWAGDDDVLIGALKAYEESKRSDVKFFIGGGGSKAVIKRIIDGDTLVPLTVTYPPKMIYNAAMEALKLDNSSKGEGKLVYAPTDVVNAQNAKDHYFPDSAY